MCMTLDQNVTSKLRLHIFRCAVTLLASTGCFRAAPPLEKGDGKEPEYYTETDSEGRVTVRAHPVVLKRKNPSATAPVLKPTKTTSTTSTPKTRAKEPTLAETASPIATITPQPTATPAGLNLTTVSSLGPLLTGSCDPAAQSFSATTTLGRVRSVSCASNGVLSIRVHLPAGSEPFSVQFTQSYRDGSSVSTTKNYARVPFLCPEGYVGVPASHVEGLGHTEATAGHTSWWLDVAKDFCVMKYPAKNNHNSTYATSTMSKTPWSLKRGTDALDAGSAFQACHDIPNGMYRLISNTQWQTIARNAESVGDNWSEGVVGSGVMNKGNSDGNCCTKANSTDDDPYSGTGNTEKDPVGSGWEQRRTHVLSNGETVWDMSGNAWQWVSENTDEIGLQPTITNLTNFTDNLYFSNDLHASNRLLFAPLGPYDSGINVGRVWGGTGGAIRRGWYWYDGGHGNVGIFAATIAYSSTEYSILTGFRCTHIP